MKLRAAIHDVCCLGTEDRDAMFRIMELSYANMQRSRFDDDLDAKTWVILVRSPHDDRLIGFSTQTLLEVGAGQDIVRALYSGDTVIDRAHWGDPALAHAWGNFALELIDLHPSGPLYWFLTSKGFRTYRYLPLFFLTYWPRPELPMPAWEQAVIDTLGRTVGRHRYDASRSIIRVDRDREFVRPEIAEPGRRLVTDPYVRFFVEQNPGFGRGDELCCLAPLTRENFTRGAYRVINSRPLPLTTL